MKEEREPCMCDVRNNRSFVVCCDAFQNMHATTRLHKVEEMTMIEDSTINLLPIPQVIDENDDTVRVEFDEIIQPLEPGQSSPVSPIEFDVKTGLRKKSGKFFAETDKRNSKPKSTTSSTDIIRPALVVAPLLPEPPRQIEKSRTRRVAFTKSVLNKEVKHLKDYTKEEIETLWMTMSDYLLIREVMKTTVSMMMKGKFFSEDDEDFCPRGLESKTKSGAQARSSAKLRARSAVLNEQDLQREESFEDPHFIAMAYIDESKENRANARARAVEDERSIQKYLSDMRPLVALYQRRKSHVDEGVAQ